MTTPRLERLKAMLAARTRGGEALPGFEKNVEAIRAEIARRSKEAAT